MRCVVANNSDLLKSTINDTTRIELQKIKFTRRFNKKVRYRTDALHLPTGLNYQDETYLYGISYQSEGRYGGAGVAA